jgi:hypothetical protein
MIDSCVYQKASLVVNKDVENGLGSIKGLDL